MTIVYERKAKANYCILHGRFPPEVPPTLLARVDKMIERLIDALAGIRALAEYAVTEDVDLDGLPGGVKALSATIVAAIDRITA